MLRAMGLERFNSNKLKPYLKMAEQRLGILTHKKTNLIKTQKREIAELLRAGKEEKARIRVEALIRMDFTIEAYEVLALLCELVFERVALLASEKECPADMREAVSTLVWASQRTEVPELREVAIQVELKYGKEFVAAARSGTEECVNTRVAHKLSVAPPSAHLVLNYLSAIAQEYDIEWTPAETGLDGDALATHAMPGPTGFSIQVAPGSNLAQAYSAPPGGGGSATVVAPPAPVAEVVRVEPQPDAKGTVVGVGPAVTPQENGGENGDGVTKIPPQDPAVIKQQQQQQQQQHPPPPQVAVTPTAPPKDDDDAGAPTQPSPTAPPPEDPHHQQQHQQQQPPAADIHDLIPPAPTTLSQQGPGGGGGDEAKGSGPSDGGPGGAGTDYDALAKRFASLKK